MDPAVKELIRHKAMALGFEDAGFTTVEPFDLYVKEVQSRPSMYSWLNTDSFSTLRGAKPAEKHPWARSILVLIRNYHRRSFPRELLGRFGRCYLVDERKIKGEEYARFKALLEFLKEKGIGALYDEEIPARMAAARSGVVRYGKNCFAFAGRSMGRSSWLEIIPVVMDLEVEPDEPTLELGCPQKCQAPCLRACPTGALYEPLRMNPTRCIAFLTYYGPDLTPLEFREAMGTWLYGCDRCQEVCPRNVAWGRRPLPPNPHLEERCSAWDLLSILDMDQRYYEERVWPQFFYISRTRLDRWQMNAVRAMGNSGERAFVPRLAKELRESPYQNVRAMCAWALGRLGGSMARSALETARDDPSETVRREVEMALASG